MTPTTKYTRITIILYFSTIYVIILFTLYSTDFILAKKSWDNNIAPKILDRFPSFKAKGLINLSKNKLILIN